MQQGGFAGIMDIPKEDVYHETGIYQTAFQGHGVD